MQPKSSARSARASCFIVRVKRPTGVFSDPFNPYSPDLSPIEMAFSKLKALIRKAAARTNDELWQAVGHLCDLFKKEECYNFFKVAGYRTDETRHALAG